MNESLLLLYYAVVLFYGAGMVIALGILGFSLSIWKKDNSVADVLYPWHFIILASLSAYLATLIAAFYKESAAVSLYYAALVLIWGVRLSLRIYRKNSGKPEDFRYAAWRSKWKWFHVRSFFQIYMLQGFLALIIAAPIVLSIMLTPKSMTLLSLLGIAMWLIGFAFETVGDAQLDRFIKNPENKGQLMTSGLWKFSRHPNYFGEALMWWGLWVISLSVAGEIWYLTLTSPLVITVLLVSVSGVPLLEARMSKHPDWAAYKAKTSMLIPWFQRKTKVPN